MFCYCHCVIDVHCSLCVLPLLHYRAASSQHIVSINRRHLNEVMITKAEECSAVKFFFEHKLEYMDKRQGTLVFNR